MIGLCMGLARRAFSERNKHPYASWAEWQRHRMFGVVLREDLGNHGIDWPVSNRYYQLLDACPLRMSTPDQPGDVQ